jgi:hypothetical protein
VHSVQARFVWLFKLALSAPAFCWYAATFLPTFTDLFPFWHLAFVDDWVLVLPCFPLLCRNVSGCVALRGCFFIRWPLPRAGSAATLALAAQLAAFPSAVYSFHTLHLPGCFYTCGSAGCLLRIASGTALGYSGPALLKTAITTPATTCNRCWYCGLLGSPDACRVGRTDATGVLYICACALPAGRDGMARFETRSA